MIKGGKRFFYVLVVVLVSATSLLAQNKDRFFRSKEVGFTVGKTYYLGELNRKHFQHQNLGFGAMYKFNLDRRLSIAINGLYTFISGADSTSDIASDQFRNLHFRSQILELSGILEINFTDFQIGNLDYLYSPYMFVGFGVVHSNPQAKYNDEWVDLQPIGTEGQTLSGGNPYNLISFAVPVGVGFKFDIVDSGFAIAVYTGFRRTFTDYLDDVGGEYADPNDFSDDEAVFVDRSKGGLLPDGSNTGLDRGNTNTKDWYNFTGITLTLKANRVKNTCNWWR